MLRAVIDLDIRNKGRVRRNLDKIAEYYEATVPELAFAALKDGNCKIFNMLYRNDPTSTIKGVSGKAYYKPLRELDEYQSLKKTYNVARKLKSSSWVLGRAIVNLLTNPVIATTLEKLYSSL